jgi:hypothetical protein
MRVEELDERLDAVLGVDAQRATSTSIRFEREVAVR